MQQPKKPMTQQAKARRAKALKRAEDQLASGTKPNRGTTKEKKENPYIPLQSKDVERIKKEIEVLKTRI